MKPIKGIKDGALVLDFQSGNDQVLPILVERWHRIFCRKAYWITKDADAAKDIAQDSWRTIILKLKDLKEVNSFGSWAQMIVHRKAIDWTKAHQRERKILNELSKEPQIIETVSEEREQLKLKIVQAVKDLPANHQMVIKLFYVEAYSLKEISELLNIGVGTAKSRLFHAREKLKTILKT